MADVAIQVENLGKLYRLGQREPYKALRDVIAGAAAAPYRYLRRRLMPAKAGSLSAAPEYIWALRDVSFQVKEGQAVAIIGRNGAGKTTLLKIISRVTEPTEGRAEIRGRVGSLLEVGAGFHPELTGRENIYFNGAVLGMRRAEIARKFDEIVAFAELEDFVETPVKRYSSGMYMRLAFAVAAHLEPEILLVDEVLAVGDAAFQQKCLGKMGDVAKGGRTILFVSHNMAAVQALCQRAIVLDEGQVIADTDVASAVELYVRRVRDLSKIPVGERQDRRGSGLARVVDIQVLDGRGQPTSAVVSGGPLGIRARLISPSANGRTLGNVAVSFAINDALQNNLFLLWTETAGQNFNMTSEEFAVECWLREVPLAEGEYFFNSHVTVGGDLADWVLDAGRFHVVAGDFFGSGKLTPPSHSKFLVHQEWKAYGIK